MNILICGYGKMGKLYGKYLTQNNIPWQWYDPNLKNSSNPNGKFSHIIIASPEDTHIDCYKKFRNNSSNFLIEKPVVINKEDLWIFSEPITAGMVERFNPTISALKQIIDISKIIYVDFTRLNSNTIKFGVLEELSIHDLDLYFYLFNRDLPNNFEVSKRENIISLSIDDGTRFIWGLGSNLPTKTQITIYQSNKSFVCDLREKTILIHENGAISKIPIENQQPLELEIKYFLSGNKVNAKKSHELMLQIKDSHLFK